MIERHISAQQMSLFSRVTGSSVCKHLQGTAGGKRTSESTDDSGEDSTSELRMGIFALKSRNVRWPDKYCTNYIPEEKHE